MKKKNRKNCLGLLASPLPRVKAYLNLVTSNCSSLGGKSVIELSASRHFHYHYSNITKVSEKLTKNEADYEKTCKTCCCKSSVANILILCSFTKKIL